MFQPSNAVRLHVSLAEIEPEIWRRLVVPADWTLDRLHPVLQAAFGWTDSHLHEFRIGGPGVEPQHARISRDISGDLGAPVVGVILGLSSAPSTVVTVPEAAMHKDHTAPPGENQVGRARQVLAVEAEAIAQ